MERIANEVLLKTPVFEAVRKSYASTSFKPYEIRCPDWVLMYVYDESGQVLVKQTRWGVESKTTEYPCGTVEENEKPEDAAKRELEEETGLTDISLSLIGSFSPNPALFSNKMHVYAAYVLDLEEKLKAHKALKLDENEDCEPFYAHKHYKMTNSAMTLAAQRLLEITGIL